MSSKKKKDKEKPLILLDDEDSGDEIDEKDKQQLCTPVGNDFSAVWFKDPEIVKVLSRSQHSSVH
jgi:hypothetical protein